MTPEEHRRQRDLVMLSSLLADTPEDRHGVYAKRRPYTPWSWTPRQQPYNPPQGARSYRLPTVNERPL